LRDYNINFAVKKVTCKLHILCSYKGNFLASQRIVNWVGIFPQNLQNFNHR